MSTEVSTGTIPDITRGDRMRAGLGVQEMAAYLDVSRNAVSNWINDRVTPSKQTMRLWALRCGVPLEWLETGKAPTLPSGPGARRTARSAVEVEQVAA